MWDARTSHGEMSGASGCVQKSRPAASRERRVELDSVSSGSVDENWLLSHGRIRGLSRLCVFVGLFELLWARRVHQ